MHNFGLKSPRPKVVPGMSVRECKEMSLLAVTAPDGRLISVETSGVDAWLACKPIPGGRVWRVYPNCANPELVAESRSDANDKHLQEKANGDDRPGLCSD